MALDEEGRKRRARIAGKASGKARQRGKQARDAKIVLAFAYLTGQIQSAADDRKAIAFLTNLGHGVNLPDGVSPLRFLAEANGFSRQRVCQILKNGQK